MKARGSGPAFTRVGARGQPSRVKARGQPSRVKARGQPGLAFFSSGLLLFFSQRASAFFTSFSRPLRARWPSMWVPRWQKCICPQWNLEKHGEQVSAPSVESRETRTPTHFKFEILNHGNGLEYPFGQSRGAPNKQRRIAVAWTGSRIQRGLRGLGEHRARRGHPLREGRAEELEVLDHHLRRLAGARSGLSTRPPRQDYGRLAELNLHRAVLEPS